MKRRTFRVSFQTIHTNRHVQWATGFSTVRILSTCRDLSSNNILLTKHLVAKISDLGMAKVIPPGLQRHTQAPVTVVFMPPEALSAC